MRVVPGWRRHSSANQNGSSIFQSSLKGPHYLDLSNTREGLSAQCVLFVHLVWDRVKHQDVQSTPTKTLQCVETLPKSKYMLWLFNVLGWTTNCEMAVTMKMTMGNVALEKNKNTKNK